MSALALAWPEPDRWLSPVSLSLSALGHLAVAGLLVAFGHFAAARMDQPKAYFVNLVPRLGVADPSPVAPEAVIAAPAPPAPVQTAVAQARPPAARPERTETPALPPPGLPLRGSLPPPPALPPDLSRVGDKESPSLASPRLAQRPAPAAPPPPPPPSTAASAKPSAPPATSGLATAAPRASVSLDVADFPFTYYLQQLQRKVSERWLLPGASARGHRAVVLFEIGRDGRIAAPRVEQSSGSTSYDLAALRAVTEASPFPPLPQEFAAASLRVHFGFEVSTPLVQGPGRP